MRLFRRLARHVSPVSALARANSVNKPVEHVAFVAPANEPIARLRSMGLAIIVEQTTLLPTRPVADWRVGGCERSPISGKLIPTVEDAHERLYKHSLILEDGRTLHTDRTVPSARFSEDKTKRTNASFEIGLSGETEGKVITNE
jgi:hypothetical protein